MLRNYLTNKFVILYILVSLLLLSLLIIALYVFPGFLKYSCDSVPHNNGVVLSQDGERCMLGARICEGVSCVAPAITVNCNESREVCGINYTCRCN
jgi:hypothetical protein